MTIGGITLILAAALGQAAPAETAWLKAVPSDTHVVVRVGALQKVSGDLTKMLKAMSPQLGEQAGPAVQVAIDQLGGMIGKAALPIDGPGLVLVNIPRDGSTVPAIAWLVQGGDYEAFQKAAAGQTGKVKPAKGKLGQVDLSNGMAAYTAKGDGYLAIGTNEALVSRIGSGGLPAEVGPALGHGDIALYANFAEINKQFGSQIDQARETFLQMLDQVPGGEEQAKAAKQMYAGLFDAIKTLKALTLSLDFDPKGLTLDVRTYGPQSGSPSKPIASDFLATLPANFAFYISYSPGFTEKVQDWGVQIASQMIPQGAQALKLNAEKYRQAGAGAMVSALDLGADGFRAIARTEATKPEELVAVTEEGTKLSKENAAAGIKTVDIGPPLNYQGYAFKKLTVAMDIDKLNDQMKNLPGGGAGFKRMLHDGTISSWIGSKPGEFLSVTAKDEAEAKAIVDSLGKPTTLSGSTGFKALQAALPERSDMVVAASGQGILRFISGIAGIEIPKLPEEPAFLGLSYTQQPEGSYLRLVIPDTFGPIVEDGFIPAFSKIAGQLNRR